MDSNRNKAGVKVILPNILGYERMAMASSEAFAKILGFSTERVEDLKTAIAEAVINAIQHGNKGRPEAVVTTILDFYNDAMHISVIDEGVGIQDIPPKPDINRIMTNLDSPIGFGLFLIQALSDTVELNADSSEGHCLKMIIKKIPNEL